MFLKLNPELVIDGKPITRGINLENIARYYPTLERPNTTSIELLNNKIVIVNKPVEWFDKLLSAVDIDDLGTPKLATQKQIECVKSLAKRKGIKLPSVITFDFARGFLNDHLTDRLDKRSQNE